MSVNPIGPEFRVNTFTTGDQVTHFGGSPYPANAMDRDGDFVVTWTSDGQDGSSHGVYGQRYSAAGIPQGEEFRINSTIAGGQIGSTIAMDADGDFVVTWSSLEQDGSGSGVYGQRYNAAGISQGDEFKVNSTTIGNQWSTTVAMDADVDFVVTWSSFEQDGSGWGVYGQRYNAAGIPQGSEFQVNTTTNTDQKYSTVAMDADGDFVVIWNSFEQDGSFEGVYGQRYSAAGIAQGSEFRVNSYTNGVQWFPTVAMDADGDFVVTWSSSQNSSGYDVFGQRYDTAGNPQGGEFQINTSVVDHQWFSTVAMDADGGFVVTWTGIEPDLSAGVYGRRYDADGLVQGDEFIVNTTTAGAQANSSVAMNGAGDFTIVWGSNGQDGSGYGIYAQRYVNATPSVEITAGIPSTEAGTTIGTLIITLNRAVTTPLTVNFGTLGTASNSTDYSFTAGEGITAVTATSFTLAAGVTTATLNLVPVDDFIDEPGGETIQLRLISGTGYRIGTLNTATLILTDNDAVPADIVAPTGGV